MKFMKNIPWIPLMIIVAIFVFGLVTEPGAASGRIDDPAQLASQLNTILTDRNFRGAALVVRDNEVILRAAHGMACDVQGIQNTIYAPFHIASLTKNFTGAAILLLEQDGKLCTSNSLDNFFPGIDSLENVTIAHLLAMQGGFNDVTLWMFQNPRLTDVEEALAISMAELEAYIFEHYWTGAPQTRSIYCNTDYWLLGRIIEQASGMPYEEFVASRLFTPAGMRNSGFSGIDESVTPHGLPAFYVGGQNFFDPNNWPFFFAYSTGGLISTVDDLNLWLDAYFGGTLFPEYLLDTVQAGDYNYGWMFVGDSIWYHLGEVAGFASHMIYDRNSSTRIILLSNEARGANATLARAVSDAVLGVPVGGLGIPRGR